LISEYNRFFQHQTPLILKLNAKLYYGTRLQYLCIFGLSFGLVRNQVDFSIFWYFSIFWVLRFGFTNRPATESGGGGRLVATQFYIASSLVWNRGRHSPCRMTSSTSLRYCLLCKSRRPDGFYFWQILIKIFRDG